MCIGSKPKAPKTPAATPAKPPVYMRNPYLDGMGTNAELVGRNSLRIDMGTPPARPPAPAPITPWTPPIQMNPTRSRMPRGSLPATGLAMGGSAKTQPSSAAAGMGTDFRRMM